MLKELRYLLFIILIFVFFIFSFKFYFSDANKKKSYRSLNSIDERVDTYVLKLPTLEEDTKDIIEYVEQSNNKKRKKFNFWKLLGSNE